MKHKHAEILKAIAENSEVKIQGLIDSGEWVDLKTADFFIYMGCYIDCRIKPEPKPDVESIRRVSLRIDGDRLFEIMKNTALSGRDSNIKFIFDGETGELIKAEVK